MGRMKTSGWAVASVLILTACTGGSSSTPTPSLTSTPTPSPTIAPGSGGVPVPQPRHVVAGFGSIWVQSATGSLWRISREGEVLATIQGVLPTKRVDDYAQPLAVGFGSVWTLSGDAIVRIDPDANGSITRIALPGLSTGIVPGADALWVTGSGGTPRLIRVDPSTNSSDVVRHQLVTPGGIAYGFASLWWINFSEAATVSRLDPATGRELAAIPTPMYATFVIPTRRSVWLVGADGETATIDPVTNRATRPTIRRARSSFGVSYSDDIVWINDGDLVGFNATTGRVVVRERVLGPQSWRTDAGVAQLGSSVWVVDAKGERVIPVSV
jgi:hypothetical protein